MHFPGRAYIRVSPSRPEPQIVAQSRGIAGPWGLGYIRRRPVQRRPQRAANLPHAYLYARLGDMKE